MTLDTKARRARWNLANLLTLSRLGLALGIFLLLALGTVGRGTQETPRAVYAAAYVLFLLVTVTDFLDGYLARRLDMATDFGRMADPLSDKIAVCGVFVFLTELGVVPAWITVVILAREFLVSGIRAYMEARGEPFGAVFWGKAKMAAQCVTLVWIFVGLAHFPDSRWAAWVTDAGLAVVVLLTLLSGGVYVVRARRLLAKATTAS